MSRGAAQTIDRCRLAEPVDVGNASVVLASPLAASISGASILLNGVGTRPAFLTVATVNIATANVATNVATANKDGSADR